MGSGIVAGEDLIQDFAEPFAMVCQFLILLNFPCYSLYTITTTLSKSTIHKSTSNYHLHTLSVCVCIVLTLLYHNVCITVWCFGNSRNYCIFNLFFLLLTKISTFQVKYVKPWNDDNFLKLHIFISIFFFQLHLPSIESPTEGCSYDQRSEGSDQLYALYHRLHCIADRCSWNNGIQTLQELVSNA